MGRRRRFLRVCATAGFAGLVAMSVATPSSAAAPRAPIEFDQLNGEGAWSVFELTTPWANDLATAPLYVNMNYSGRGSLLGREDLVRSLTVPESDPDHVDFAISGIGFTPAELAGVAGGSSAFISAPVQVASLAAFVEPPIGGFKSEKWLCNPDILDYEDPSLWPPGITDPDSQCITISNLSGPVRIPWRNLAAMLLGYKGVGIPPLGGWNQPDELDALGLHSTSDVQYFIHLQNPNNGPGYSGRSDADEITYRMQEAVQLAAPDVWEALKNEPPIKDWEPITERLPQVPAGGVTRDGAEQQVDQLGLGCGNVSGSCAGAFQTGGGVAPAPASLGRVLTSSFPDQSFSTAEVKNANGDWVAPTPDAINKAVDAGGSAPLYALTNKVPGAYPLAWVDNLYAPAHGLSAKRTESVATLIRYLVTTGQEHEAGAGEGRLPAALVRQSLDAANALVLSNCVGKDRIILSSTDPGPLAPPAAVAMRSIGNMLHCATLVPEPATTTTTVVPTTTTTVAAAPESNVDRSGIDIGTPDSGGAQSLGSTDTTPPAGATEATTADTSGGGTSPPAPAVKRGSQLLTALKLPLRAPSGGSSADRLATFLLGAALYLLVRRPLTRLARRITS